jgi:membrane fusion protein, multidrug efflux system
MPKKHYFYRMKFKVILFFLCISIAFVSCTTTAKDPEQEVKVESLRAELKPTEVEVVQTQIKPFEYIISSSGKIEAEEEAEVFVQYGGQLEKLTVANGAVIQKGQLLASLNNDKQKLEMQKAENHYKDREIEFNSLKLGYTSGLKGNDSSSLSIKETLMISSGLAGAKLSLEQAKLDYSQTLHKAPISGKIANLAVKKNQQLKAGDLLCKIYSADKLLITTKVLESEIGKLKQGQAAIVNPVSDPGTEYKARVHEINPFVDEHGMVQIKLKLMNTTGLLPGMNAHVKIFIPYNKNIIVPKQAVVLRSGKEVVFTLENGLAKWNYVKSGMENGVEVEILKGLKEGAEVIVTNNLQLAHDAPVVKK